MAPAQRKSAFSGQDETIAAQGLEGLMRDGFERPASLTSDGAKWCGQHE